MLCKERHAGLSVHTCKSWRVPINVSHLWNTAQASHIIHTNTHTHSYINRKPNQSHSINLTEQSVKTKTSNFHLLIVYLTDPVMISNNCQNWMMDELSTFISRVLCNKWICAKQLIRKSHRKYYLLVDKNDGNLIDADGRILVRAYRIWKWFMQHNTYITKHARCAWWGVSAGLASRFR